MENTVCYESFANANIIANRTSTNNECVFLTTMAVTTDDDNDDDNNININNWTNGHNDAKFSSCCNNFVAVWPVFSIRSMFVHTLKHFDYRNDPKLCAHSLWPESINITSHHIILYHHMHTHTSAHIGINIDIHDAINVTRTRFYMHKFCHTQSSFISISL